MTHVEIEECIKMILAARDNCESNENKIIENKIVKKEKQILVFDKFIAPCVKLDFQIKISGKSESRLDIESSIGVGVSSRCARCNGDIEFGEVVCSTKCCRRTMHSSCLLELYCHEDTPHSEFRCDTCSVSRKDKYGRNTEMLMWLSGGFY